MVQDDVVDLAPVGGGQDGEDVHPRQARPDPAEMKPCWDGHRAWFTIGAGMLAMLAPARCHVEASRRRPPVARLGNVGQTKGMSPAGFEPTAPGLGIL